MLGTDKVFAYMIRTLKVKNFQSHSSSEIEFSPKVNVIIGPSDQGKTSLLRAMRWVIENRPNGTGFRSRFTKEDTVVTVETTDGDVISRSRGEQRNTYGLNEEELVGFGTDVPDSILDALDISSVNYQYQHDPPFLLSESAGAVARFLNQTVALDQIDTSLKYLLGKQKQTNNEITTCKKEIDTIQIAIDSFPDLQDLDGQLQEFEQMNGELERQTKQALGLQSLVGLIAVLQISLDTLPDLSSASLQLQSVEKLLAQYNNNLRNITSTHSLSSQIRRIQTRLKAMPKIDFAELDTLIVHQHHLKSQIDGLRTLITNLKREEELSHVCVGDIEKWTQELARLMPAVCPLCGTVLKKDG